MTKTAKEIIEELDATLKEKGITLQQCAKKTGIEKTRIHRIRNGQTIPRIDEVRLLEEHGLISSQEVEKITVFKDWNELTFDEWMTIYEALRTKSILEASKEKPIARIWAKLKPIKDRGVKSNEGEKYRF